MARHYRMRRVELYKKLPDNSWDTVAIELTEVSAINVKRGIGKIKDTFEFNVNHANDKLTRKFFSGDGSTVAFTLQFAPPSTFLNTDKVKVYVGGVLQNYTSDYTISGTTLTFTSAPASGNQNIEVEFEVITADDKVRIYLWKDAEWGDLDEDAQDEAFQMEGIIKTPRLVSTSSERKIAVSGLGFIEAVFNALAFVKPVTTKKWYTIIQEMIAQINQNLPAGKKIYGQDATEWSNLGNPTMKNDGTSFPDVQFSVSYKRGIEILEEVTQDKYTQDGEYIYWVEWNRTYGYALYVRYKDPVVTSGDEISQGVDPLKATKAKRSTDNVVNAIIYNCGFDPLERGMEYLNFNPTSQSSLGSSWKYVTSTSHLGQTIVNIEFENDESKWETTTKGTRKENFPKNSEYPYTFTFEARTDGGELTGSAATAANDDEFADVVRVECKWRGKDETDRIIKLYSNPRYEAKFTLSQTNDFSIGNQFSINLPSFGLHTTYPLRLMDMTTTFWETTLVFEEDETLATA
jgi:hypothetical protein